MGGSIAIVMGDCIAISMGKGISVDMSDIGYWEAGRSGVVVGPLEPHELVVLLLGHLDGEDEFGKVPHGPADGALAVPHAPQTLLLLLLQHPQRLMLLLHPLALPALHLPRTPFHSLLQPHPTFALSWRFTLVARFAQVAQPQP